MTSVLLSSVSKGDIIVLRTHLISIEAAVSFSPWIGASKEMAEKIKEKQGIAIDQLKNWVIDPWNSEVRTFYICLWKKKLRKLKTVEMVQSCKVIKLL